MNPHPWGGATWGVLVARVEQMHKLRAEHTDFCRKHARAHRIDCIFPRYRPIARCCQPEARVGAHGPTVSTRSRRYGPRDPHAPNTEHSYPPHDHAWRFLRVTALSNHPQEPPAPLRFIGGLPTDLQWTARGHNTAKSWANPRPQTKHVLEPCFMGVFVDHYSVIDHYSVSQAELGAYFARLIDSIHQGLSNAVLD